jgi:hypothetical protein
MSPKRALIWGAISGCIFGLGMLLLGKFFQSQPPGFHGNASELLMAGFYVVHWPLNALGDYFPRPSFAAAAAIILGYWIIIAVAAGLLFWLFRDCRVRGFRRHRVLLVCGGWVLGTLALHCWVLHPLTGRPSWAGAKQVCEYETTVLNDALSGYAGTPEDRARARAAMQMQMPGPQMPGRAPVLPSVEQKLAIALRIEENVEGNLKGVAAMAESAYRRTVRRAWISWATTAFIPVILFALVDRRTRRLSERLQPGPPPH